MEGFILREKVTHFNHEQIPERIAHERGSGAKGTVVKIIAPRSGLVKNPDGKEIKVDHSFLTFSSVLVDAIFIPGGEKSIETLKATSNAIHFIDEAFLHCKAIATDKLGADLIKMSYISTNLKKDANQFTDMGVLINNNSGSEFSELFIKALGKHRFFAGKKASKIPA
ncbi:MAG: catalase HPII [Pedobacter sp.]|nr:catalase HPII [Pedobacter sp.]